MAQMLLSFKRRPALLECFLGFFSLALPGDSVRPVKAFSVPTQLKTRRSLASPLPKPAASISSSLSTRLFLSDFPEQPPEKRKQQQKQRKEDWPIEFLPPAPEDELVMMGDLFSLAIFGFSDHFLTNALARLFTHRLDSMYKIYHASATIDSQHYYHAPVWLDCTDNAHTVNVMQLTLQDRLVTHYSPLMESTGVAICLLMTAWLLAGWVHGAFLFKHTLQCSPRVALMQTVKTWVTSSLLVFGVLCLSSSSPEWEVLPGDVSFVVGSLSALVLWRFLASWILGTGKDV